MKNRVLVLVLVCTINTAVATAQVSVAGRESQDKSVSAEQVTISTMDHSFVPLTVESKQIKVDANTTRTESTARARLNDGSYFDWRDTVTVQHQVNPTLIETIQDVVEKDRQGGTRTTFQIKQEITKTPNGEESRAFQYRRNSSGAMTLDRAIFSTTTKNPDGSSLTTSTEEVRDVNGNLQPGRQTQATVVTLSPTRTQITTQIKQPGHMEGRLTVVAREMATVDASGGTTRTERTIQQTEGTGWKDTGKVITTETRQSDGTLQRETVEEGQTLYSKQAAPPMNVEPLVPRRKIVERELHKPDGTLVIQRDVFRRDINGDWKPQTFSTEAAAQPGAGY